MFYRLLLLTTITGSFLAPHPISEQEIQPTIQSKPAYSNKVQQEIYLQTLKSDVSLDDAMRIAQCESRFDPKAKNTNSSASGVYQFIKGTWENYCTGDVFNATDNISCFIQQYPKNPSWWECR